MGIYSKQYQNNDIGAYIKNLPETFIQSGLKT